MQAKGVIPYGISGDDLVPLSVTAAGAPYVSLISSTGVLINAALPSGAAIASNLATRDYLGVLNLNYALDGSNWQPINAETAPGAALTQTSKHYMNTVGLNYSFNGTTWNANSSNAAAVLSGTTQSNGQLTAQPGEWAVTHAPGANATATITKASGGAGVRHVCRSITASVLGLTTAAETTINVRLRDGAAGAGTILWSQTLYVPAGGQAGVSISGLNIIGSAATAMTLEFSAAGGANTTESVSLSGYSTI